MPESPLRICCLISKVFEKQGRLYSTRADAASWRWLKERGHQINPCRSKLHPAVTVAGLEPEDGEEICVQRAYAPDSSCFGCGPSADAGLHLQSFRAINGLRATVTIPRVFQAFPGIVNGGIVNTLFDCHGNWSAALALMDKAALPRPPFTLSSSLQVNYHEPTPPATELLLESKVVAIEDHKSTGADKVTVALELFQALPENRRRLLASGRGVFNKKGALRAM